MLSTGVRRNPRGHRDHAGDRYWDHLGLGGVEVDDKDLGRQLNWKFRWLCAADNSNDVRRGAANDIADVQAPFINAMTAFQIGSINRFLTIFFQSRGR
jgi:hypothetical protein